MPRPTTIACALLALAAGISACSGQTVPPPGPAICSTTALPAFALAFPPNGATQVSDSISSIYLYESGNWVQPNYQLQLVANGRTSAGGTLAPPSPQPTPFVLATPPANFDNFFTLDAAAAPPVAPATTYQVQLLNAQLSCGGFPLVLSIGSFTTR